MADEKGQQAETMSPTPGRSLRSESRESLLPRPESERLGPAEHSSPARILISQADYDLLAGGIPVQPSFTSLADSPGISSDSESVIEEFQRDGDAIRQQAAGALKDLYERIRESRRNPTNPAPSIHSAATPERCLSPPPGNAYGKLLSIDTRLNDQKFYKTNAAWARIPHPRQAFFLGEGLRIAQTSLWETSRELIPDAQNKDWPEGACMVKFGQEDLQETSLVNGVPKLKSNDIDQLKAAETVQKLIYLRNAVAHPGKDWHPLQGKSTDNLLMTAQKLAVFFHDRRHATEVRALRDKLQKELTKSYAEIKRAYASLKSSKSRDCIGSLGLRRRKKTKWAPHHERMFYHVLSHTRRGVPAEIKDLANIWNRDGHRLSQGLTELESPTDEDNYRRLPGQDEDYFRRENKPNFDVDTPEFKEYIKKFGASRTIANMSAREMMAEVQKLGPTSFFPSEEEARAEEAKAAEALQSAIDDGAFTYPDGRGGEDEGVKN